MGDPQLENLESSVQTWWSDFVNRKQPRWLTICGTSGTGKTTCARSIWRAARDLGRTSNPDSEFQECVLWWPDVINELRNGEGYDRLSDLRRWPLLVIDEIGADRDTTGFVADRLYYVLAQREKKWTVLTSNVTVDTLRDFDQRIASRCFRDRGLVVSVETMDYAMRGVPQ